MPIGVIPAIIAAGGAIGGSAIAAHAAGKAADTQAQSGQKALDVQQNIYNQTRADLSPYASAGVGAVGNLRALLGLPANATPLPAAGGVPAVSGAGTPTLPRQMPAGATPTGVAVPRGSAVGSSYVRMMSPTGEVGTVPSDQVGHYTALGAKVIGA